MDKKNADKNAIANSKKGSSLLRNTEATESRKKDAEEFDKDNNEGGFVSSKTISSKSNEGDKEGINLKKTSQFSSDIKKKVELLNKDENIEDFLNEKNDIPNKNGIQKATSDSIAISMLLGIVFDFAITFLGRFDFFSADKLSSSEKKELANSFEVAFPSIEINAKFSFFTTIFLLLASRLSISQLSNKNNKQKSNEA